MEAVTIGLLFFSVLVMGAVGVFVVCVWKIVRLIALYKMETRIEELEAMSKEQNDGKSEAEKWTDLKDILSNLSPKESKSLRRLSYLAGLNGWSLHGRRRRHCHHRRRDFPLRILKRSPGKLCSFSNKVQISSKAMEESAFSPPPPWPSESDPSMEEGSACSSSKSSASLASLGSSRSLPGSSASSLPTVHRYHHHHRHGRYQSCAIHGKKWSSSTSTTELPIISYKKDAASNTDASLHSSAKSIAVPLGSLCSCQLLLVRRSPCPEEEQCHA